MLAGNWTVDRFADMVSRVYRDADGSGTRTTDDVYGFALLSIAGELILMSNELRYISMLDDATIFSMYSPFISTKGRFRLDTPVFQTLCGAAGAMFEDMVEPEGD